MSIIIGLVFFSFLNFKNKCFLGDNGSYLLSFIFGYYLIRVHNNTDIYYSDHIVFLILFFPVIDTLRVIFMRQFYGKQIFLPDNNHLHHMIMNKCGYNKTIFYLTFLIISSYFYFYWLKFFYKFFNSFIYLFLTINNLIKN